jgi:hypothetical protein
MHSLESGSLYTILIPPSNLSVNGRIPEIKELRTSHVWLIWRALQLE